MNKHPHYEQLVPFERDDIVAVWCCEHPRVSWDRRWETADHAQLYDPRDIAADINGDLPLPYGGAWVARRWRGAWWYRTDSTPIGIHEAEILIAWALSLRGIQRVPWIGRDGRGWERPRGYYGLIAPRREFVLATDSALRWVVTTETPHGDYALAFDRLEAGADGQPHPLGLWQIKEASRERNTAAQV